MIHIQRSTTQHSTTQYVLCLFRLFFYRTRLCRTYPTPYCICNILVVYNFDVWNHHNACSIKVHGFPRSKCLLLFLLLVHFFSFFEIRSKYYVSHPNNTQIKIIFLYWIFVSFGWFFAAFFFFAFCCCLNSFTHLCFVCGEKITRNGRQCVCFQGVIKIRVYSNNFCVWFARVSERVCVCGQICKEIFTAVCSNLQNIWRILF